MHACRVVMNITQYYTDNPLYRIPFTGSCGTADSSHFLLSFQVSELAPRNWQVAPRDK